MSNGIRAWVRCVRSQTTHDDDCVVSDPFFQDALYAIITEEDAESERGNPDACAPLD